jgi:hypothetical protein
MHLRWGRRFADPFVFLHEVLDCWFEDVVRPRLKGQAFLVRYADDAVIVFSREEDTKRVMEVLPQRFGKYGLTLHPEKTRLVPFRRPSKDQDRNTQSGTFDLLGFTHYWGKSLKGSWVVKRQTARSRLTRALRTLRVWTRRNFHRPIDDQHAALGRKIQGHYAYYGITGNARALMNFLREVTRLWRSWLGRRSDRAGMSWQVFNEFMSRHPLPRVRIVHSAIQSVANP